MSEADKKYGNKCRPNLAKTGVIPRINDARSAEIIPIFTIPLRFFALDFASISMPPIMIMIPPTNVEILNRSPRKIRAKANEYRTEVGERIACWFAPMFFIAVYARNRDNPK